MKARLMWSSLLVIVVLGLVTWGILASDTVTCVKGQACLPLPGVATDDPARIYLPLILGRDSAGSCEVELENNDVHTQAQALIYCVDGQATTTLDIDWYRLEACQGPIDLQLALEGADDVDLYLYGDPPGQPLATSESWSGTEGITITDLVTGTYYAVVQPAMVVQDPEMSIAYTLSVEATWSD